MEMYRASLSTRKIEKIQVLKVTEKQVKYNEFRRVNTEAKVSNYHSWHPTFNEAFDAVEKHISDEIKRSQSQIERQTDLLRKFHQQYSKDGKNGLG